MKNSLERFVRINLKHLTLTPEQYENPPTTCAPYVAVMKKKFLEGKSAKQICTELRTETAFQGSESAVAYYVSSFRRKGATKNPAFGRPAKCKPYATVILAMLKQGLHPFDILKLLRATHGLSLSMKSLRRFMAELVRPTQVEAESAAA